MKIEIPEVSLVVLIGAQDSGKKKFIKKHFSIEHIKSKSFDSNIHFFLNNKNNFNIEKIIKNAKIIIIENFSLEHEQRKILVSLAKKYHYIPIAIVFNIPPQKRESPHWDEAHKEYIKVKRYLGRLHKEGFKKVYIFNSLKEIEQSIINIKKLKSNLSNEKGPFDIIGDVHGCFDELIKLIKNLGYNISQTKNKKWTIKHPNNRKLIFLGDLVDRGPKSPDVLKFVMDISESDQCLCLLGNHDTKLVKALKNRKIRIDHGLEKTLEQIKNKPDDFKNKVIDFITNLSEYYTLDGGNLVVAHAGLKKELQGKFSGKVRHFALYGDTTGSFDEYGVPIRRDWPIEYDGNAFVVYGHIPVKKAQWINKTIDIDTGCVFGGELTALRYPEMDLISILALKAYYKPAKPIK